VPAVAVLVRCGLLWRRRVDARVSATYGARRALGGRRFLRDRKENRGDLPSKKANYSTNGGMSKW
jgi:hypothetical protein